MGVCVDAGADDADCFSDVTTLRGALRRDTVCSTFSGASDLCSLALYSGGISYAAVLESKLLLAPQLALNALRACLRSTVSDPGTAALSMAVAFTFAATDAEDEDEDGMPLMLLESGFLLLLATAPVSTECVATVVADVLGRILSMLLRTAW